MTRIALVTDSSCGLPVEIVREYGIYVVPLDVIVEDKVHRDLSSDQLISALRAGQRVTTSKPSPAQFTRVFEQAAGDGFDSIVAATLSASLSGTYESAVVASRVSGMAIEVVDSGTVGLGLGFAVADAARLVAEGETSLHEISRVIAHGAKRAQVLFYLDTLEYLRKGGRIGAASALIGSALAIKPILQVKDGEIAPAAKVRTESKALERMVESAVAVATPTEVPRYGVQHLGAWDRAQHVAARLREVDPAADIVMSEVSAVVGAHAGPGLVAVIASPRPQVKFHP
jgi:DegV family protein with EDD domain